jgi:hypothetical protein
VIEKGEGTYRLQAHRGQHAPNGEIAEITRSRFDDPFDQA